jgi:hypothetical protein
LVPGERTADLLWKWVLRVVGLVSFAYVLFVMRGDVAVAVYVLIGGLIGLPNVVSLQGLLNEGRETIQAKPAPAAPATTKPSAPDGEA